jgi:hypothetical protein
MLQDLHIANKCPWKEKTCAEFFLGGNRHYFTPQDGNYAPHSLCRLCTRIDSFFCCDYWHAILEMFWTYVEALIRLLKFWKICKINFEVLITIQNKPKSWIFVCFSIFKDKNFCSDYIKWVGTLCVEYFAMFWRTEVAFTTWLAPFSPCLLEEGMQTVKEQPQKPFSGFQKWPLWARLFEDCSRRWIIIFAQLFFLSLLLLRLLFKRKFSQQTFRCCCCCCCCCHFCCYCSFMLLFLLLLLL